MIDGTTAKRPPAKPTFISPTRTKETWKPGISDDELPFYRCETCGCVLLGMDGAQEAALAGSSRRPDVTLPYATNGFEATCCGKPLERLQMKPQGEDGSLELSYDVVGGFDANAVRVHWKSQRGIIPRWIALKTFSGVQIKYVLPEKKPPVVFALADEDAYAYCDEDPCLACTFHCKRGFEIYAFASETGLITRTVHQERLTS